MYLKSIKNFLSTYIFFCITLIGSIIILFDVKIVNKEALVIVSFIINGVIIMVQLCKKSKLGYSLKEILFLFLFIFMFFSPLIQYIENSFPWGNENLLKCENIVYSNFLIMAFMLIYIVTYKFSYNKDGNLKKTRVMEIKNIKLVLDIFFMASILASVYIISKTGLSNLFARSTNLLQIESTSFSLIVTNTFRAIPVIYIAMNLLFKEKNNFIYKKANFILALILMILINFPTATARFWMASVYIGLLIIIKKSFNNKYLIKMLIFIGILFIFPFINVFRNNTILDIINKGIDVKNITDGFLKGDFDSYSMLTRSIIYTNNNGITMGYQLIGNLLFFIPRTMWAGKPIGSGATIAEGLGWNFTNVSCPYIGEGYINFGVIGVMLFAIILGRVTKFGDKTYEYLKDSKNKHISFIEVVYPFSIGFLFFILRGDLLSSISFYIGFMSSLIALNLFQRFLYK